MEHKFDGLTALVQYTREDGSQSNWTNMAAFDFKTVAERYAKKCSEGDTPWLYRVVDVDPTLNQDG